MNFSETGVALLKQLEGFRAKAYPDSGGRMTIGYGHLIVRGDGVATGDIIDPVKGTELLLKDAQGAVNCVNGCVLAPINQNMFDALVIFVYNVGAYAFQNSGMLTLLNKGDFKGAADQFLIWDKVKIKGMFVEVAGLKNRRLAEQKLFLTPVETNHG